MKTQILMAVIVAGFTLSMVPASAQDRGEQPDFATLDANSDGTITLEELRNRAANRFAEADSNGDGALSAEELTAQMSARAADGAARMIERMDGNEDGLLQLSEIPQRDGDRAERMFERADADGDGEISEEEFDVVKERRGDRKGGKGKRDGHRKGGRG